jgi:hypothetical protein
MARAGARRAPLVSAWLRGFGKELFTAETLDDTRCHHLKNSGPKIPGAIILIWMMAPEASTNAVLACHHPLVVPRTITGIIRTNTRYLPRAIEPFAACESFVVAACNMFD